MSFGSILGSMKREIPRFVCDVTRERDAGPLFVKQQFQMHRPSLPGILVADEVGHDLTVRTTLRSTGSYVWLVPVES